MSPLDSIAAVGLLWFIAHTQATGVIDRTALGVFFVVWAFYRFREARR